jgi:hypothetical protein
MPRPRLGNARLFIGLQMLSLPCLLACPPSDQAEPATRGTSGTGGRVITAAVGGNGTAGVTGVPLAGTVGLPGLVGTPSAPGVAGAPAVGSPGIAGAPAMPPAQGPAGAPPPPPPAGRDGGAGVGMPMGVAGMAAAAGAPAVDGSDPFSAERQACVEHINMYRATLMLAPLKRATPEQELCSDAGAMRDGDSGQAHGSAGSCKGLGGQNTCPGYPVRAGSTLTKTLTGCLDQMWAEGEPPNGTDACIADRTGCFLMHGHWINMSMKNYGTVACGFYKMANGRYWMNQNFGR